MRSAVHRVPLMLLALGVASCVSRAELEEIKKNQKDILAKLDQIAKGGGRAAPQRPRGPDPSKTYAFPVGQSPVKGPKDAWVTIIEVSDFQWPYCKRVGPTLKEVQDKYGNDVRIVFKHNALPFHKRAMPAANASMCANEQGKFWEMHDAIFENNRALEDADFEKYAQQVGLDMGRYKSCYTANKHKAIIDEDQKTATSLGARGTPAFFINGRYLSGAQPFANFARLIDEELKKAKASGMSKSDYYDKAVVAKGQKTM